MCLFDRDGAETQLVLPDRDGVATKGVLTDSLKCSWAALAVTLWYVAGIRARPPPAFVATQAYPITKRSSTSVTPGTDQAA